MQNGPQLLRGRSRRVAVVRPPPAHCAVATHRRCHASTLSDCKSRSKRRLQAQLVTHSSSCLKRHSAGHVCSRQENTYGTKGPGQRRRGFVPVARLCRPVVTFRPMDPCGRGPCCWCLALCLLGFWFSAWCGLVGRAVRSPFLKIAFPPKTRKLGFVFRPVIPQV